MLLLAITVAAVGVDVSRADSCGRAARRMHRYVKRGCCPPPQRMTYGACQTCDIGHFCVYCLCFIYVDEDGKYVYVHLMQMEDECSTLYYAEYPEEQSPEDCWDENYTCILPATGLQSFATGERGPKLPKEVTEDDFQSLPTAAMTNTIHLSPQVDCTLKKLSKPVKITYNSKTIYAQLAHFERKVKDKHSGALKKVDIYGGFQIDTPATMPSQTLSGTVKKGRHVRVTDGGKDYDIWLGHGIAP
jgi:hypothetical protein